MCFSGSIINSQIHTRVVVRIIKPYRVFLLGATWVFPPAFFAGNL